MADRGAKTATIARCLAVISQAHKAAHVPSPTLVLVPFAEPAPVAKQSRLVVCAD